MTGRINEIFSIQQELSAVAGALIDPESDLLAVLQLQQEQHLPEGEAWRVLVESKQAVASHIIEQQWRLYKEMAVATDAVESLTNGCAGSILAQGSNGEVQVQGRFCGSRDESLQGGPAFETALVERSSDPSGGAGIFEKLLSGGAGIFEKLRNLLDGLRD